MAVGTRGQLKPIKGPAALFTFTEVTAEVGFTDVSRLPLARLTRVHHIERTAAGSRFIHRATISGPLAPLFARAIGKTIKPSDRPTRPRASREGRPNRSNTGAPSRAAS